VIVTGRGPDMLDQTIVKALCAGFVGATIAVVLDHVSVLGMSMMLWIAGVMIVLALFAFVGNIVGQTSGNR